MALTERQKQVLQNMGVQAWESRFPSGPDDSVIPINPQSPAAQYAHVDSQPLSSDAKTELEIPAPLLDWEQLQQTVLQCRKCELHASRTQAVFGVGNPQAQWMVIGEAPGADEDRQGEPFVGRAGQLLNNMLFAIGLKREEIYIANILKCRPPNNRDPKPEEVAQCEGYLQRQVQLIQPKIILAVGRIAAHNLLKTDSSLVKLRGRTFNYNQTDIPVVVTYHPAYLLRSPKEKRKSWQDLQFAVSVLNQQKVNQ